MRFSDTPLWWRLLVIAVTMAVLAILYAVVAAMTEMLPIAGKVAILSLILAWSFITIARESSNRKRLAAPQKPHQIGNKLLRSLRRLREIGRSESAD